MLMKQNFQANKTRTNTGSANLARHSFNLVFSLKSTISKIYFPTLHNITKFLLYINVY